MRIVLQRVSEASVMIAGKKTAEIQTGLLLLLGVASDDNQEDINWLCKKIAALRIFADENGKMNHSIGDINGEVIVVSQFTLYANVKKGTRPSFVKAAPPAIAIPLYEQFVKQLELLLRKEVQTGVFGADMQVQLTNDGPVTILLDSKNKTL
jgi:D-tyrosyl-tRNA(Tyr) deacylase